MFQDSLRGSLHHKQVAIFIGVIDPVNGHLELISRVEGDLTDLLNTQTLPENIVNNKH